MINLSIIEKSEPSADWFSMMKSYASVADDAQDALLQSLFNRAVLRVQEMADKSLLACTIRLEADEAKEGVRLYQSVKDIISVKDGNGNAVEYSQEERTIYAFADEVVVEYTTEPNAADIEDLLPVVYQYATALYDGQDNRTLANILKQCR